MPHFARELTAVGRRFYARGWALGTSGNFSAVSSRDPLRLAISAKRCAQGRDARVARAFGWTSTACLRKTRHGGKPSAETLLHVEIVKRRGAGAVLHTHSVWATILSGAPGDRDGLSIDGFEMLKGLSGVRTHEHREWIPILENDQDMPRLAHVVGATLERHPNAHAVLLRRHGLYTWGDTLAEAERHVEILEFLFEAVGRTATYTMKDGGVFHGALENS